jgi:hypothetical protein
LFQVQKYICERTTAHLTPFLGRLWPRNFPGRFEQIWITLDPTDDGLGGKSWMVVVVVWLRLVVV